MTIPSYAIHLWAEGLTLYAAVPSAQGTVILEFQYSEGGLSKALALLGAQRAADPAPAYVPSYQSFPSKALGAEGITRKDLLSAHEALKALGVLK